MPRSITLASSRPAFRKNGYIPAFSEGWGLYSESLPAEVGLYVDPYSEYGRLEYNAWRCARLVVDTGLHAKGWTRQQALDCCQKLIDLRKLIPQRGSFAQKPQNLRARRFECL